MVKVTCTKEQQLCVDYRRIRAVTVGPSKTMPIIEEAYLDLETVRIFSTIDVK